MGLPLLLRGKKLSLLERNASAGITASQTPDPLFPLLRLGDTRPSQLFIFPSRLEDEYYHIDVDQYRDSTGIIVGDFENWTAGVPNGHIVSISGTAAVTEETTSPIFTGASSMELTNGALPATIEVTKNIEVLAGDQVELRYAAQTSSAGSPATLEVFNPYTGKWLTTSGTWSLRRQNAVESALTVMAEATLGFTVEAFSAVRNHEVSLKISYHMRFSAASTTHHWDAVRWIPAVDFSSIHAHNMSAGITPRLVSSDVSLSAVPIDRAYQFDGTNDHASRATDFSGTVDGQEGTIAFSFRRVGGLGSNQRIFLNETTTTRFSVFFDTNNRLIVSGSNTVPTVILNIESNTQYTDSNWHRAVISWNLLTGVARFRIDGADDLRAGPTLTNDTIDYTFGGWSFAAFADGSQPFNGELGEMWFNPTQFIDVSIFENEVRFETSANKVALWGENGELITGTSPIFYWAGDVILTNRGTGGNFDTLNGAPTNSVKLEAGEVEVTQVHAELTKRDVSFYAKLPAVRHRQFWKFHMRGLNAVDPIDTGLWNLAQSITPPWSPRLRDNQEAIQFPQTRAVVEASGEQWAIKKAKHELLARTFQGVDAIVLVENQNDPKVVHGRTDPESEFVRRSMESELVELIVEESSNGIGLP
jgi:hypothetical protein